MRNLVPWIASRDISASLGCGHPTTLMSSLRVQRDQFGGGIKLKSRSMSWYTRMHLERRLALQLANRKGVMRVESGHPASVNLPCCLPRRAPSVLKLWCGLRPANEIPCPFVARVCAIAFVAVSLEAFVPCTRSSKHSCLEVQCLV
jgi:hypothetical protein